MFRQFLANFVWLDICVIIIIARACWIGLQKGSLVEVFKMAALLFAIFVGLHFYSDLTHVITNIFRTFDSIAPIFSYVVLTGLTIFVFRIFRDGIEVLFKSDEVSKNSKIGGLVLGFCRGVLLSGLVVLGCLIANHPALTRSVRTAYLGSSLSSVSANIYLGMYRFIIHPVFPNEEKKMNIKIMVEKNNRKY